MKRMLLTFILLFAPGAPLALDQPAASRGAQGFAEVRQCVMQNDLRYCRAIVTPDSLPYLNRFFSYKLMPCLPTDFTYAGEQSVNGQIVVKATSSGGGNILYVMHLVFDDDGYSPKLDLPASFRHGLGGNWQDKLQMSEQLYLMMKQNMGDRLTCDQLNSLMKPQ